MNAFDVSRILTAQGADKGDMALVLESLHKGNLLPTWGEGATGAEVSARDVVSIVLGSTAEAPKEAAQHCIASAALIRADGLSLGEALVEIMKTEPCDIHIDEITVGGDQATIRHMDGTLDAFYTNGGLRIFRRACIIRGAILGAIGCKMKFPTESGWTDKCDNSLAGISEA